MPLPAFQSVMNVLVYSGPEVLPVALKHTLSTLRRFLLPNYSVQPISVPTLKTQPWTISCALFVFPECRSAVAQSTPSISAYVEGGGSILCLSAGAHLPSRAESGGSGIDQTRFFDPKNGFFIYPVWRPGFSKIVDMQISEGAPTINVYQSGQGDFVGVEKMNNAQVLATYTGQHSGKVAALRYNLGAGKIIFCGVSPEYPLTEEPALSISTKLFQKELMTAEQNRVEFLRNMLSTLGLSLSSSLSISRPLPQFLVSHPERSDIVLTILNSLAHPAPPSELDTFEDSNDTFLFRKLEDSGQLLSQMRQSQAEEFDSQNWQPKLVIVCNDGKLPEPTHTPLFDLALFFRTLSDVHNEEGRAPNQDMWGCGDAVLYSEAVTSTQTMLDKNPRLLAKLPAPILSLASHQLAGRGRGANSWISPPGCLQFSLHLRVSLSKFPANKLVFVQYLFGLAVTEACRNEAVLGKRGEAVRIKWPNDIYAVFGDREQDRKKIGGILVSTNFSDRNVDIIIGCGVNVLNPPPIFSLDQLQRGDVSPLSMEKTAAAIMCKFEKMWHTFVEGRGSFAPFIDLYLERWLHSDQLVLLTTFNPPKSVRICGITLDHGLLRTLPERAGWPSEDNSFIDLQPDGNSFDLMAGLIKTKS